MTGTPTRTRTPKHIEDRVLKLYAKGLNRWKIAGETGVSEVTVSKIVHRRGAPKRAPDWQRTFETADAIAIVSETGSFNEAARRLGVLPTAVCRRLRGMSIPGRPELDARSRGGIRYTDDERDRALEMYEDIEIPVADICATIGCNASTLRAWAVKAGIPRRPEGAKRTVDPEEARELYAKYGKYTDVAFVLDASPDAVARAVRGYR